VAIELRVTRHPFSFIGDQDQSCDALHLKRQGTWKDRLLDYTGGDPRLRDQVMAGMKEAGKPLGIHFDYNCYIDRQPIDSQRMLLFAARHGKQEEYMTCLNRRHFTRGSQGESASKSHTILAAAKEAGLDAAEADAFLKSGELRDQVWRSYGQMPKLGITAIPLFVFNVVEIGLEGGPLRPHASSTGTPPIVNGSMTVELFEGIFDDLWDQVVTYRRRAQKLTTAAPSPPRPLATIELGGPQNNGPAAAAAAADPPAPASASSPTLSANVFVEIPRKGGDLAKLLALAKVDLRSAPLHAALKELGYAKLGDRMRAAAALAEEATRRADDNGTAGEGARPAAPAKAEARLVVGPLSGKRVVVTGLSAKPQLNGKVGTAGKLDARKGRYAVRLVDSTESLSIRVANLNEEAAAAAAAAS